MVELRAAKKGAVKQGVIQIAVAQIQISKFTGGKIRLCAALIVQPEGMPGAHDIRLLLTDAGALFFFCRQIFRLQPLPVAVGAGHGAHDLGDLVPDVAGLGLPEPPLQVVDDALKFGVVAAGAVLLFPDHVDALPLGAVEEGVQLLFGQVLHRGVQGKAVMLCQRLVIHLGDGAAFPDVPAAGLDGALPDGEVLIGNHHVGVHLHERPQPRTGGAGAHGIVEGKILPGVAAIKGE